MLGLAGENRANPDTVDRRVVAEPFDDLVGKYGAGLDRLLGRQLDRLGEYPTVGACLEVGPLSRLVGDDVFEPDPAGGAAVLDPDDELLGDVDQPAGQVPRVRGTKRGVGETLPRTVGRDEVLEHRQALTEGGLDRPRDHLAAGVRHETLHSGDLADLLGVTSGTGVDHHVERVERHRRQRLLHRPADLGGRRRPDLDLLLAPLVVGDDTALELRLGLLGLALVAVEDCRLLGRRPDVVDRDGETRLSGVTEPERLDAVEALGHDVLRLVGRDLLDDGADAGVASSDHVVHVGESVGQSLVEEQPSRRRLDRRAAPRHRGPAPGCGRRPSRATSRPKAGP